MESQQQPTNTGERYRMSWTAYVRPIIVLLVFSLVGYLLTAVNIWFGVIFILFWLGLFTIQVLTIRSVILFTDEQGVWLYSGIFPWSRGTSGVKWRDVEDAVYFPNFMSWLLKSYTVRIGHRFTKSSEIVLPHIARGHEAVEHINNYHHKVLASTPGGSMA